MKKKFKLLIILIAAISFTSSMLGEQVQGRNEDKATLQNVDRLQRIKERGVLNVLSTNTEPYSYRNPKSGIFSGVDAEIIKEVAKRLGIEKVEARYTPFTNVFTDFINNPDFDIIADGIYITDERKQIVNFTIPLYKDWGAIMIRKDSGINSREDLKNRTIGIMGGTVHSAISQGWKEKGIIKDYITLANNESLKLALLNRTVDAILTDSIVSQDILIKNPGANLKLLSPTQYKSEINFDIGYPIKKEDTTFLNAVNEALQEMKNDGTLYEILIKNSIRDHYIP